MTSGPKADAKRVTGILPFVLALLCVGLGWLLFAVLHGDDDPSELHNAAILNETSPTSHPDQTAPRRLQQKDSFASALHADPEPAPAAEQQATLIQVLGQVSKSGLGQVRRVTVEALDGANRFSAKLTSDAEGKFSIALKAGRYRFGVPLHKFYSEPHPFQHRRFPPSLRPRWVRHVEIDVQLDGQQVELKLPECGLRVLVRDKQTGRPIRNAKITLHALQDAVSDRNTAYALQWQLQSDVNGLSLVKDLQPADFSIEASKNLYQSLSLKRRIDLNCQVVELELEPRATLIVKLQDADDKSALTVSAGIRAELVGKGDTVIKPSRNPGTSFGGPTLDFAFENIRPGPYILRFLGDSPVNLGKDIEGLQFHPILPKQDALKVEVEHKKETILGVDVKYRIYSRLTIQGSLGEFSEGARLEVYRLHGEPKRIAPAPWQGQSAHHAGAHFDGYLKRGRYLFRIIAPDGVVTEQEVEVQGQPFSWSLNLGR